MARLPALLLVFCLVVPAVAREGQTVTGRVVDEHGKPVAKARVHVGQYWPGGVADTDVEGRFRVTVAPGMPAPISVFANGYRTRRVEAEPGTVGMRIVLDPGVTIRGRLRVPAGTKMPATIRAVTGDRRARSMHAQVAADGSFALRGFEQPDKPVEVALHAPGHAVAVVTRTVDAQQNEIDVGDIALVVGRPLTVLVRDHHDKPLAGVHVQVSGKGLGAFSWRAPVDAEGRVHFPATTNGVLEVRGTTDAPRPVSRLWTVAAGSEATTARFQLEPYVLVRGTLALAGGGKPPWEAQEPVSVLATVLQDGKQVGTWFGRTAGNGASRFVLEKGSPGRYQLVFSIALGRWWRSEPIQIEIPRSALDTQTYDLGVLTVRPTSR